MVIKFLENTLGQYQINQLIKKNKREPQSVNLSDVKKVTFLCEVNESKDIDEIKGVIQLFESNHVQLGAVICLLQDKEVPNYIPKEWKTVVPTERNLWGLLNRDKISSLFELQADLFCNLCINSSILTHQIMQVVNAKCIAGFSSADQYNINDLSIELPVESGVLDLSNNIIRYLKMLNN